MRSAWRDSVRQTCAKRDYGACPEGENSRITFGLGVPTYKGTPAQGIEPASPPRRIHWSPIPGSNAGLENPYELVLEEQGAVLRSSDQCVKLVAMTRYLPA